MVQITRKEKRIMFITYKDGFFDTDELVLIDYDSQHPENGMTVYLDRSVVPGTTALTESILNSCRQLSFVGVEAINVAEQLRVAMDAEAE